MLTAEELRPVALGVMLSIEGALQGDGPLAWSASSREATRIYSQQPADTYPHHSPMTHLGAVVNVVEAGVELSPDPSRTLTSMA
jgi:hypothetical protein